MTPRPAPPSPSRARSPGAGACRLLAEPLASRLGPAEVALLFAADPRPFALVGAWAGGGALVGSEPLRVDQGRDPFAAVDRLPSVAVTPAPPPGAVGGGWFGYLGYQLGARVERLPAPPARPVPLPPAVLGFYDHLLRYDQTTGQWWFESLWTPGRSGALAEKLARCRARLAGPPPPVPAWRAGRFTSTPDRARHLSAVAACRAHIAAGDVFQANVCLRLEAAFEGAPAGMLAHALGRLVPPRAAWLEGPWGAVVSLSPELYLRRQGRQVVTAPIKGTCPRDPDPAAAARQRDGLVASAKDRAENVMIVDLMRNDLARVCRPGTVDVPALVRAEPHPGIWHLVSRVHGILRDGVRDSDLLRATFPPGSVTGAPKPRAMELIHELESTAREVYTGAIGYASPLAGLELSVVIRTFELADGRVWLGVGGGVVADSDPAGEHAECLAKARPLLHAIGADLDHGTTDPGGSWHL